MKNSIKILAAILALVLAYQLIAVSAAAVSTDINGSAALFSDNSIAGGYCGEEGNGTNLSWTLSENGVLTISGSGKMYDWAFLNAVPWYDNVYSIRSVVINEGVTSIGNWAFFGCTNLVSADIPNSVTSIGRHAFYGCTSLNKLEIPESVTSIGSFAFFDCGGLTEIDIPESVTNIGSATFSWCTGLTEIMIPRSAAKIGGSVFLGCQTDVYCLAEEKPERWNDNWMYGYRATVHWGYKPPIMGDLNGNGVVEESEIMTILDIIKGITPINEQYLKASDYNKDGKLDIRDFNYIYNIVLKKNQTP